MTADVVVYPSFAWGARTADQILTAIVANTGPIAARSLDVKVRRRRPETGLGPVAGTGPAGIRLGGAAAAVGSALDADARRAASGAVYEASYALGEDLIPLAGETG